MERDLRAIVGDDAVLTDTGWYLTDMTGLPGKADAVVLPSSADEVARVVAWCYEHDVPITPRGGGTGAAGGAVPLDGGIVLALDRMARVRGLRQFQYYPRTTNAAEFHESCRYHGLAAQVASGPAADRGHANVFRRRRFSLIDDGNRAINDRTRSAPPGVHPMAGLSRPREQDLIIRRESPGAFTIGVSAGAPQILCPSLEEALARAGRFAIKQHAELWYSAAGHICAPVNLLRRIWNEYVEMPGLRLTNPQAQRLWALDAETCSAVLESLVELKFLRRGPEGRYFRLTDGNPGGLLMAKADVPDRAPSRALLTGR